MQGGPRCPTPCPQPSHRRLWESLPDRAPEGPVPGGKGLGVLSLSSLEVWHWECWPGVA